MSCCGQKRQQWQQNNSVKEVVPVSLEPVLENPVVVQHKGSSSVMIKGKITGYIYVFAANDAGLKVDGRDAAVILQEADKFSYAKK